jgi:hypothetical protein
MDKITFVDYQTKICSAFLNTVSDTVWDALGQAKTPSEARTFIGAVDEAPLDGEAYLRQSGAWLVASTSLQHNQLGGRSDADAHPIAAITGLQNALDAKAPMVHTHDGSEITDIIAAQVSFSPSGTIVATNVQAALAELDSETQNALSGKQPNLPSQIGQAGQFLSTNGTTLDWTEPLPSQTGNAGEFLTTNGSVASWATVDALPPQAGNAGEFLTTDGSVASWTPLQTDANSTTKGMYEHAHTITVNYAIAAGNNAVSGGPMTVADGVTVTVPNGSVWSIT